MKFDHFMGIKNLRTLHLFLSKPPKEDLMYVYGDLNNFKAFNDNLGHPTGDKILQTVAQIFQKNAPQSYRLGGDEFVIIVKKGEAETLIKKLTIEIKNNETLKSTTTIVDGVRIAQSVGFGTSEMKKGTFGDEMIRKTLEKAKDNEKINSQATKDKEGTGLGRRERDRRGRS